MKYETIRTNGGELVTVPDFSTIATAELEPFAREWLKRKRAERTIQPRSKVERPCPYCSVAFGARALRAHKPQCTKRPPAAGEKGND